MGKKYDKVYVGLISGILAPVLAFFAYYLWQFRALSFLSFWDILIARGVLAPMFSLSAIPNLLVFFVFIWTDRMFAARGVLAATFVIGFVIVILKFAS